jgi:uncharacterized damage-inducible protein DinB
MYRSLLDRLRNQHESVRSMIEGLDDVRLTAQIIPGKWSIKDNIAHLASYQPVFAERIGLILKNDKPNFERYKADDDPEFDAWRQLSTETLLKRMDEDRQKIHGTISKLSPAELKRTGIHKKYGALTVTNWTEFFILHEAHHLFTVFQLMHDTQPGK